MTTKRVISIPAFQKVVRDEGKRLYRDMPWRRTDSNGSFDPYKILVSEFMLQQTQVKRVVPKYQSFVARFSTVHSLAEASLGEVLAHWNGLGYNRRAKYLHDAAKKLAQTGDWSYESLVAQKGIGPNTAAAIRVYSHNEQLVFIETNIRSVFLHYFFRDNDKVSDKEIMPLVQKALTGQSPREFYWALMDTGTSLKTESNPNVRSSSYKRQSKFSGSLRQIRGAVIRELTGGSLTYDALQRRVSDIRLPDVLKLLAEEELIQKHRGLYKLPE